MKISPSQSNFLNWSRWVAAWFVVAEHARNLIFWDYADLNSPSIFAKAFYFITGFGHEAVMVFFVISGFLVGGKVWSLYRAGRFGWRRYLADRLSRLYAVLIVALLLGATLDWAGYSFFNSYGLYNKGYEVPIAVLGAPPCDRMGLSDFIVNALFLQKIIGQPYGSNGPLWSLAYEWWYYILFPALLMICLSGGLGRKLLGTAVALCVFFLLPANVLCLFGIWCLGVLTSLWVKHVPPVWLTGGVFALVALMARLEVLPSYYIWQYALGVAFSLLLVSLNGPATFAPLSRLSHRLADFSYSVYLIHFPVLMFTLSLGFDLLGYGIRMPFSFSGMVWYFGIFGIAIITSWLISLFTECKTSFLRLMLYRLFCVSP